LAVTRARLAQQQMAILPKLPLARFKQSLTVVGRNLSKSSLIQVQDKASEAILALKPVTFRYKQEIDPEGIPQFGLVAEQVEKVNPDLVVRGEDGKVSTVRYEAVNAMLLNEFLKEHSQVQQLKATVAQQQEEFHAKFAQQQKRIAAQQATAAQQQKQIEALAATVQKVALSKPAPQLVANP
jgi:septal ring factor EnvC (AmiA/AmiB activator)